VFNYNICRQLRDHYIASNEPKNSFFNRPDYSRVEGFLLCCVLKYFVCNFYCINNVYLHLLYMHRHWVETRVRNYISTNERSWIQTAEFKFFSNKNLNWLVGMVSESKWQEERRLGAIFAAW